jgi:hypothetical protein
MKGRERGLIQKCYIIIIKAVQMSSRYSYNGTFYRTDELSSEMLSEV